MAITRRTLRLAGDLRVAVAGAADQATRELVQAWALAWDGLAEEMSAAVEDLLAVGDGAWPSRAQIRRATRAQRALAVAREFLAELAADAKVRITDAAGHVVNLSAEAQPAIIASQFPPGTDLAGLVTAFDQVSPAAIRAIVARSTQQITSLTRPLSVEATDAMKRALIRGVAVGDNPRAAAAQMLRRLEGGFNGGLTRAMTVARTEILDAHRAGAAASHHANADVLRGWVWTSQLDRRTCPACFAMHGSEHQLDEPGPSGHQQCRCTRIPQTRSWYELGLNIPEPASIIRDGRAVFGGLSRADKLAVMGPARLAALDSGRVSWGQLAMRRRTDGWRDSIVPTPLAKLGVGA